MGILYLKEQLNFPVTYKVCGAGYSDCHDVGKFKDRYDCEVTNKKWSWSCNESNKENIVCVEEESNISSGYCK